MSDSTVYAGFWRRLVAAILDQIVLSVYRAILFGIIYAMGLLAPQLFDTKPEEIIIRQWATVICIGLDFWLAWIYFALMESSSLQGTLGKLALGTRVFSYTRTPVTFEQATVRYFAKTLGFVTLLVGFFLTAFSSKKQGLHDFVAKSVLIVSR